MLIYALVFGSGMFVGGLVLLGVAAVTARLNVGPVGLEEIDEERL